MVSMAITGMVLSPFLSFIIPDNRPGRKRLRKIVNFSPIYAFVFAIIAAI